LFENLPTLLSLIEKDIESDINQNHNISLFNGIPGYALFYFYLYRYTRSDGHLKKAFECLDRIADLLKSTDRYDPTFCNGLAGLAFLYDLLHTEGFIDDDVLENLVEFDEILADIPDDYVQTNNMDFLHGLLGILHYYIERSDKSEFCKNISIKYLRIYSENILTMLKKKESVMFWDDDGAIKNVYNLGAAHGLTSGLLLLSQNKVQKFGLDFVEQTVRAITEKILEFKKSDRGTAQFPSIIRVGETPSYDVPLGWCYGDNVICYALLKASKLLNDQKLRVIAEEIGLKSLQRTSPETAHVKDAILCHGSASIGYIYHRIFQLTNNEKFKQGYLHWLQITIGYSQNNLPEIGYRTHTSTQNYKNDLSFLGGSSGIGLALLQGVDPRCCNWGKIILLGD
jgi:lantibiotic modifying enzyme